MNVIDQLEEWIKNKEYGYKANEPILSIIYNMTTIQELSREAHSLVSGSSIGSDALQELKRDRARYAVERLLKRLRGVYES